MSEANIIHTSILHAESGIEIRAEGNEINLSDMHRASGSNPSRSPYEWLRQEGTKALIAHLESVQKSALSGAGRIVRRSPDGHTPHKNVWVHWHLGMAYAQYLSPAFQVWCNEILRSYFEGKLSHVVNAPVLLDQLFPHHTDFALGYERHLKRLTEVKAMRGDQAIDLLSEVYEGLLGVRLPRVRGSVPREIKAAGENLGKGLAPEEPASGYTKEPEESDRPVPKEGDATVHLAPGEVALAAGVIDGRVWWTANELGYQLDEGYDGAYPKGLLTQLAGKDCNREQMGKQVAKLLREMQVHPGTTQSYSPPPGKRYELWSLQAGEGVTVRVTPHHDKVAVQRGQVFFNATALEMLHTYVVQLLDKRASAPPISKKNKTKEEVLGETQDPVPVRGTTPA